MTVNCVRFAPYPPLRAEDGCSEGEEEEEELLASAGDDGLVLVWRRSGANAPVTEGMLDAVRGVAVAVSGDLN